jgi:hypothetical protein
MGIQLKNNASGTLATAISASDTGIVLTTGNGASFPALGASDYFYATLESTGGTFEVIKVTVRSGDSMTVVRAQEGSTANSFAAGSRIELRVTAQSVLDAIEDATDAQQVSYDPPFTGSVATNVEAKLAQYVSVLDFGADPTGVIDSTTAIENALATGLPVFAPTGQYKIQNLELARHCTLFGSGQNKTFFNVVAGQKGLIAYGSNTAAFTDFTRPILRDFALRGSNYTSVGLDLYCLISGEISNVDIRGFQYGLRARTLIGTTFSNSIYLAGNVIGLYVPPYDNSGTNVETENLCFNLANFTGVLDVREQYSNNPTLPPGASRGIGMSIGVASNCNFAVVNGESNYHVAFLRNCDMVTFGTVYWEPTAPMTSPYNEVFVIGVDENGNFNADPSQPMRSLIIENTSTGFEQARLTVVRCLGLRIGGHLDESSLVVRNAADYANITGVEVSTKDALKIPAGGSDVDGVIAGISFWEPVTAAASNLDTGKGTGFYRVAADKFGYARRGVKIFEWNALGDMQWENGRGIDFSLRTAGRVAGTVTNDVLLDYQEGTWVPVISGSSTAGTYQLAVATGTYTKVGRVVALTFTIQLDSAVTGGGAGDLQITGLPYQKRQDVLMVGSVSLSGVAITASKIPVLAFPTSSASATLVIGEMESNTAVARMPIGAVSANDLLVGTIQFETAQ